MDKKIFPFLNCLCLCSYALGCGTSILPPRSRKGRVIGGQYVYSGKYPWMISLQDNDGYGFIHSCGASLINENWIISAGHCAKHFNEPWRYRGIFGLNRLSREDAPTVQKIMISKVVLPKDFVPSILINDIALFKTAQPVDISGSKSYVNTIRLPSTDEEPTGDATVAGWGRTEEGSNSDILRESYVQMIPRDQCNLMYQDIPNYTITPTMICAGADKKDACKYDSGGPLFQTNSEGVSTIIGIVSKGIGCGSKYYPGVYTKVSPFRNWIEEVMKSDSQSENSLWFIREK